MAKITDTIELIDGVSPTFAKIASAAENYANRMQSVGKATQSASDSADYAVGRFSALKNVFAGSFLANMATGALDMVKNQIMGVVELADHVAGTNARLQMISGSQENVVALNNMIFESAQKARGEYMTMADTVASLSVNARDAFPDPRETIGFVEGLQKLFVIGGASAENQKFALLQLQQALSSGRLQGDEFRSITENAPILQDMIAKTMGITRGELKELSTQGAITADIIKKAVLDNADEIEERFGRMPKTWADHMTEIKNTAMRAFGPVISYLSRIANSPAIKTAVGGIKQAITSVAPVVYYVVDLINRGINMAVGAFSAASRFIQQHSFAVRAVLILAATAMGIFAAQALWAASGSIAAAVATGMHAAASVADTVAIFIMTAATEGLTAAFMGLNATMFASPLFIIPAVIVLIVGALYLGVAAFNHFAGTSISATGIVVGAFSWAFAIIRNILVFFINMAISVANFFASVWNNPLDAIYNLFADIWNGIVGLVAAAINNIIDMINKIPGIDKVKSGGFGHVDWTVQTRQIAGRIANPVEYSDLTSAAQWGYEQGASIGQISVPQVGTPAFDPSKLENQAGNIAGNTGKGADAAKRTADALDSAQEDLRYLREIAEREAINKYTTASVTIEMGGMTNNISNEMDIDGVVDVLSQGLLQSMAAGARKVHA
ncbi:MAG: tape measure protein [Acidaminococcus provencensis]|uniref:tape measure protein n=1 Tax=Acidaminococcus provencensis TaxID=2058289 RepID=UPI0023F0E20E|nr:tape measure protein [Acidaminococcus provencensis]MCH4097279.1 tape measure protein [Acidaminococcus provencensis]